MFLAFTHCYAIWFISLFRAVILVLYQKHIRFLIVLKKAMEVKLTNSGSRQINSREAVMKSCSNFRLFSTWWGGFKKTFQQFVSPYSMSPPAILWCFYFLNTFKKRSIQPCWQQRSHAFFHYVQPCGI